MKSIAVIPARLGSTRLPRKMLLDINGHPLLWHVWNQVKKAKQPDRVVIATDSDEIRTVAENFGAQVIMTSPNCKSGTERIASIIDQLDADLIINVQGDEPLISPDLIDDLAIAWQAHPCEMITAVRRITDFEELVSPNSVKVTRDSGGNALYFSRSPIPFLRDIPQEKWLDLHCYWGHVGIYGYSCKLLYGYANIPTGLLEKAEKLEQLRFLEAGIPIRTIETQYRSIGVDVEEDLIKVREQISSRTDHTSEVSHEIST